MIVRFLYPRWGAEHIPWADFLDQVAAEGYAGIEWFPFGEIDQTQRLDAKALALKERGLQYTIVMTVVGAWDSFEAYCTLLEQQLTDLCALKAYYAPRFISAQVGREYFTNQQIIHCLALCDRVAQEQGVVILQETHRNKWSYGLHRVSAILKQYENIRFTLDLSHWFCVSESYLEDREAEVLAILPKTKHIHARIGSTQSAQVYDVRRPEFEQGVQRHWAFWKKWLTLMEEKGEQEVTMTTEFGPPPYGLTLETKALEYVFQWEQNKWMKNYLQQEINKLYDIT